MAEKSYEGDGTDLIAGDFLTTKTKKYVIREILGKGGYGCVFRVAPMPTEVDGPEYALKLEKRRAEREHAKLGMEMHILKLVATKKFEERSHIIDLVDRAKKQKFFFIVMTLVGPSLADLKRERYPLLFTSVTTYMAGLQCLEGLEQLHNLGYIHRDVKPGNYAIGRGAKSRTIYILDFGIARCIFNKQKELKGPRVKVGFKGTLRYAPLNCHLGEELGKKDDCESWIYMLGDMSNPKDLPWKGTRDRAAVLEMKKKARNVDLERTFSGLDHIQMGKMLEYLDKLKYSDGVDYAYLYDTVRTCGKQVGMKDDSMFDWEVNPSEKSSNKVKREKTCTQMISILK